MGDEELIGRVARGDEQALRALFHRHAPMLAVRLRAMLPAADVEDVLQETFIGVWRGASRYRPDGAGAAWLWGIARRQAALLLRRRRGATSDLVALAAVLELPSGPDPAEVAVSRVDLEAAEAELGPLGSPERDAWQLLHVQDRSVAEVARLMGVPAGTVKSRAHRARQILRTALGDRHPAAGGTR